MKERPILMSAPMVRAILDGRKTMTRRIVKKPPTLPTVRFMRDGGGTNQWMAEGPAPNGGTQQTWPWTPCPYGVPGDRLWVRETWAHDSEISNQTFYRADVDNDGTVPYLVSGHGLGGGVGNARIERWRPSIFMPRWASRITLEVTGVRVERVQDISESDALAEGVMTWAQASCAKGNPYDLDALGYFELLWSGINGRASWDENPFVWVVEFKRISA